MSRDAKPAKELSPAEKRALVAEMLRKKAARPKTAQLSFAQQRLWFLNQLAPEDAAYNISSALRLSGHLNVAALQRTLSEIVRRHESLRTSFRMIDGQPMQVISAAPEESVLPVIDLSKLPGAAREQEARRLAMQESWSVFKLSEGGLLRVSLLRLEADEHVLLFATHHIISDEWSMGVLVREVTALYEAYSQGLASPLSPLPVQYADFAQWQRQQLQGEVLETALAYWREQLDDSPPVLRLPLDRPRQPRQRMRGASQSVTLPAALTERIKAFSREEQVTPFMTLLAAFEVLLYRYTRQTDITVGTTIANRNRIELEGLIGFFVNSLVLRTDLSGEPTFRELLQRVRQVALGAYSHQEIPFEKLVDELQPERAAGQTPFFQVVFQHLKLPGASSVTLAGLTISPFEIEGEAAKFDLTMSLIEREDALLILAKYNAELFDETTIARLLQHYEMLLRSAVAAPQQRILELPLLTEDERQRILELNPPSQLSEQPTCLHHLFAAQVERTPESVAVTYEDERLSYRELNRRANRLAHHLRGLGVGAETRVGVLMERSVEMVVALLAILKADAAYVPLDPAYPPERLAFTLADAQISVLLTHRHLSGILPEEAATTLVCLDGDGDAIAHQSADNPVSVADPDHLAYVIYTSGSTGSPKGVMVTHRNVSRLFAATRDWFHFGAHDVWTLFHSYAFDFSVWELWGALLYGGRLVIVPYRVSRSPEEFYRLLSAERVTVLNQTPSAFRQLMAAEERLDEPLDLALRLVIFGGEALELASLRRWYERHDESRPQLVNMYGITETCVHVTSRPLRARDSFTAAGSLIGAPITDLQVYVLDERLRPVPTGIAGEMFVGGGGVARGYLNRPALTAERFIPHPFSSEAGARLYKTGDLARRLADGDLEYLGRSDQQVKIRGFRIELGEIEAALNSHPAVREAVVVVRDEQSAEEKRLVAYVVGANAARPGVSELREYLKEKLPEYMIPAAFVLLDELPLTPNGKLDRRALPAPDHERPELDKAYVAPRTEVEQLLAEMWRDVLGVESVGIHDNFFELGGDSIKGAMFINNLQEKLGEIIHVVVIFDAVTIAELSDYLDERYPQAVAKISQSAVSRAPAGVALEVDTKKVEQFRALIKPFARHEQNGHEPARKNPQAIFILSPPRSGSTLLRVMLAGHPLLFAPPELELLSFNTLAERNSAFSGRDSFWLEGAVRAIMEIKGCDVEQAKKMMADYEAEGLSTRRFYGLMQDWIGDRRLVDKTPSYALDRAVLERAEADFEDALYIHLLRHPQAMIRSFEEANLDQIFFRYPHNFSTAELAELIWVASQQNIMEFLRGVPTERQHPIRFEDVVKHPQREMESLCRFLGVEFHPDMIQPYKEKQKRMSDGIHATSRMLGDVKFHSYRKIDEKVADRWREQHGERALGQVTRGLAASLGYETKALAGSDRSGATETVSIQPLPRHEGDTWPLSFSQQRFWFLDQLNPGNVFYNIVLATRLSGALNVAAFSESLNELVRRHEVLRTTFKAVGGEPVQVIAPSAAIALPLVDLRGLRAEQREREAQRLAAAESRAPFDLSTGPLLRATLMRFEADEYMLLFSMHHIISDGWSMGVLVKEMAALYEAFAAGKPSPLPELPAQYADFAVWQRGWMQSERLEAQLSYWREQLADLPPPLELPADRPRPQSPTFSGAMQYFTLPKTPLDRLRQLSRQEGATLFMTLLAAFKALLYYYTGQEDMVVGTNIANRTRRETESLIGCFFNCLVLRTDLSGAPSFRELLRRERQVAIEAYAHQDVPFEKLVEVIQPERHASRTPLFQVLFLLENAPTHDIKMAGLEFQSVPIDLHISTFDIALLLWEKEDELAGTLEYSTEIFDAQTISRLIEHFIALLRAIGENPDHDIKTLTNFRAEEARQLMYAFNEDLEM